MSIVWAKLIRVGGSEDNLAIPSFIPLIEKENFVGRFSQPAATAATKSNANTNANVNINAAEHNSFHHKDQFVIPCLFVSSTHFSISLEEREGQGDGHGDARGDSNPYSRKFVLRDFSRNGTFLRGQLVGTQSKEIVDGDEIALRYKDQDRIVYRFQVLLDDLQPLKPLAADKNSINNNKSVVDSSIELFTAQITALQEEAEQLEKKVNSQSDLIDSLTEELEKTAKQHRLDEKNIANLQSDLDNWKERVSVTEANATAISARNVILEEQLREEQEGFRALRSKFNQISEELKDKTTQLDSKRKVIDESNKVLSHEKTMRMKAEGTVQDLEKLVDHLNDKNEKVTLANQALQDMLNEMEQQLVIAKTRLRGYENLRGRVLKKVQDQSDLMRSHYSALDTLAQALQIVMSGKQDMMSNVTAVATMLDSHQGGSIATNNTEGAYSSSVPALPVGTNIRSPESSHTRSSSISSGQTPTMARALAPNSSQMPTTTPARVQHHEYGMDGDDDEYTAGQTLDNDYYQCTQVPIYDLDESLSNEDLKPVGSNEREAVSQNASNYSQPHTPFLAIERDGLFISQDSRIRKDDSTLSAAKDLSQDHRTSDRSENATPDQSLLMKSPHSTSLKRSYPSESGDLDEDNDGRKRVDGFSEAKKPRLDLLEETAVPEDDVPRPATPLSQEEAVGEYWPQAERQVVTDPVPPPSNDSVDERPLLSVFYQSTSQKAISLSPVPSSSLVEAEEEERQRSFNADLSMDLDN
eukprot:gene8395-9255_t